MVQGGLFERHQRSVSIVHTARWLIALLLIAAVGPTPRVAAAQGRRPSARVGAVVHGDDNPFLLSESQRIRLGAPSTGDSISGRFRDMESVSDVIPVASASVEVGIPGPFRRPLALSAGVDYEANVNNVRRRHAELSFSVEQPFAKGDRARLSADWRPSYFWKNYLSDAIDADADGNISSSERIYSAATSGELDLTLSARRQLARNVTGALAVGYFARGYDAPHQGRDRHGPGAGAGVSVDAGRHWTVGIDYAFQSLHADVVREVSILDENDFGVDFNGVNGATDSSARAFELLDRSRVEHNLQASIETSVSDVVTFGLGYGRRIRVFSSVQPYDVSNRGRRDDRNEVEAALTLRLANGVRLTLDAMSARQSTNRRGDPSASGDVSDYSRTVVSAGVAYRF